MKLHLPKQLFTALLAAITLVAIPAAMGGITKSPNEYYYDKSSGELYYFNSTEETYYSATTGQVATTQPDNSKLTQVSMYIGESSNSMTNSNVTAPDGQLIGFQLGDNGNNNWFDNSTTYTNDILIYDVDSTDTNKQGLIISNGNSEKIINFEGSVYGNGVMYKRGAGKSNTWKFTGDATNYTGDIFLSHSDTAGTSFVLQFGKDDGSSTQRGSATAGVAGTGAITFGTSYNKLVFSYSDAGSPVYITNIIKVGNNIQSKVELSGDADVVFTKDVTIHQLTTNAGSITFAGTANIGGSGQNTDFNGGELIVNSTGKLYLNGNASNIGKLNAGSGTVNLNTSCKLTLGEGSHSIGTLTASGTVELGTNSLLSLGAASHTIGTLSGSGALSISSSASNASATISKLGGYTGTITVDKAGTGTAGLTASVQEGSLNLAGITVKNGATATIKTRVNNNENLGQDISLGNVSVGGNSTLTVHFSGNEMRTATLTTLDVNGTAAVVANNYHGQISINSLTSSGDTNALTLTGKTPSDSGRTVFNLKDGAFDGSINFIADASGTRKFALNIENSSVVQDAVIDTSKTSSGENHHMAIGIGADSVTVKGLTGGAVNSGIYSGSQAFNNDTFSADSSKFRTLIIDTDGSKGLAADATAPSYSTSSSLSSNLNLQKDGAGSQTFTGNLSAFNGTVTVNQGTLALESTAAMNSVQSIGVNGGELKFTTLGGVTGVITMKGGSFTTNSWSISSTQQFSVSGDITMSIGTVNIADNHTLESSGAQDYFTHTYESDVESYDGNGYRVRRGDFILFKGLAWNTEEWGTLNVGGYGEVNVKDNNTVVTVNNVGTGQFFINNTASYDSASILGEHGVYIGQEKTLGLDIATGEQTLSTNVEGSGALEKTGAGTLKLTGSNTYGGGTTIAAGTLSVAGVESLGTGTVTVGVGAELEYTGSTEGTITALTLNDGAEVNATSNAGTLKATTAAATGAFTKNGDGTLVLNSVTQLGGTVTVNKGVLQIGGGDQKLNSAQVNGGTLRLTGTDIINWGDSVNIQVLGGTLDLDARQSVDSTTAITLNNGIIEGDGGSNRGYTVGLELHNTSTLTITSTGTSSITTNIGMRKEQNDNGGTVKFAVNGGTLSVSGKIEKNQPTDASISGKVTKSGAGELILSGDNTYANGTTIEAGTVTTQHTNALGSGGVTMTGGELKITDVANTDTDLTLKGMLEMNASASAKLATAGTTLNLGTTGSVKKNADGSSHVTISSNGAAASMAAKSANVELIRLEQDASFTIADMTLTNTSITAATVDTKVDLKNIDVTNVTLEKGAFTVGATPVVGTGESANVITYSADLGLGSTSASLTLNLDVVSAVAGDKHGVYTLVIELGNFDYADFAAVEGDAWTTYVGFQKGSWLAEALSNTPAALTEGGAPTVSYGFTSAGEGSNVGMLTITINGLNVPEPTTSTLSLLALAGLCARRRRKND